MAEKRHVQRNSMAPSVKSRSRVRQVSDQTHQGGPAAPTLLSLQQLVGNRALQRHLDGALQTRKEPGPAGPEPMAVDLDLNERPLLFPGATGPYVELLQNKLRSAYVLP